MKNYVYDIECLENLFTATFVNAENDDEMHVFCVGVGRDDSRDLNKFLTQSMTLIGYNNHSYDDPMLRFFMLHKKDENLNSDLYKLSGKLVDDGYRGDRDILKLRYPREVAFHWYSIDLMKILAFDKLGISLKQTAINLKWYKIQDMPKRASERVSESELEMILDYNLNDVLITKALYEKIAPLRKLREDLSKIYKVDLSSASDSKMANLILENIYANELRLDIRSIKDMRTERESVSLGDCIAKFVKFETPHLNEVLDRISATIVKSYTNFKYNDTVYFANCTFALGIGGLHSEDEPGIFVSDDKYLIQDMDVASYYPNLIINNNFYPEHLGLNFIRVLKRITQERLEAKKSGDKVKADGLKITINSIFGKLGSPTFWLMDAKQMLSTTVSGQMGLLMLIEDLTLAGIEVISCNTDGIVCKIKREMLDKYYEVATAWQKQTGLELEFTPYKKYVRRDVNSYITQKEDGSVKEKGAFLSEVDLKKSYHMPIVAKALHAYFIDGVPVRKTLEDCKDIMEFCISQKTGGNFVLELHTGKNVEILQKTNRYYITTKGGALIKREYFSKKLIGLNVGRQVRILNNYDVSIPFEDYKVDYNFYEKEIMKIIDEIEPKQMTLFEMSGLGRSSLDKVTMATPLKELEEEEEITVTALNKLGKNQLTKRLESIVTKGKIVEAVSPRYVYIVDFESKSMLADVYCLAKGTRQLITIDRRAFKKQGIQKGQLVYCVKFGKVSSGFSIVEYRIENKLVQQKESLL